jgi:hypothetical protein
LTPFLAVQAPATLPAWTNAGAPLIFDGDGQGPSLPDQHHQPLAPGHPRVQQLACEYGVVLRRQRITTAEYSEPWLLWMVVA